MAMTLVGFALSLTLPCQAEPADDADFAALQADAKKSFRERGHSIRQDLLHATVTGTRRQKGGVNFAPALKNPGDAAFSQQWKQALANVKAHDMPPEDADKQPTDAERQMFVDWIGEGQVSQPEGSGTVCHPPVDQGGVWQHAA